MLGITKTVFFVFLISAINNYNHTKCALIRYNNKRIENAGFNLPWLICIPIHAFKFKNLTVTHL